MADNVVVADEAVDLSRRKFLTNATIATGAVGAVFVAVPFVESWTPSERARALGAPTDLDIIEDRPGSDDHHHLAAAADLRGPAHARDGGAPAGPRRGSEGSDLAGVRSSRIMQRTCSGRERPSTSS